MKNLALFIISILSINTAVAQLDRSIRPKPGPAPTIKMGTPSTFTLPNGLRVFVVENHKLPTITLQMELDIMPAVQPNNAGYRDFIGELLMGGTKNRTKEQFNLELDGSGARISAGAEGFFASSLTKNQDKMMELLSDMILNPNFSKEELEKIRKQNISGLEANQDDPDFMSGNIVRSIIYGNQHIYGEVPTQKSYENITLADCQRYYQTYYRPNVAYLAVVGDITPEQAKQLVTKYLGKWQKGTVPRATYPTPKSNAGARVAVCNKSGAVQSVVNVTYPIDLKPGAPDLIALRVANEILGGGSSGRLFQNLREKHGWTYGSYSSVDADILPNAGTFSATAKCRTEVTDSSVREILAEMNRLRNELVDAKNLQDIKNSMAGTFGLSLEDPRTLARFAIQTMRYKLPKDYYSNYLKNLAAITPQQVQAAAKKYINPGIATITVAGDKTQIAEKLRPLSATGKVEFFDMFGAPVEDKPVAVAKDVTAESVIRKHIAAVGGADAWGNVTDITTVMSLAAGPQTIGIKEIKKAPNKSYSEMSMGGTVIQKEMFNGTSGYKEAGGQRMDLEADGIADAKDEASFQQELAYLTNGTKLELTGTDKVDGKDVYVVKLTKPNGKVSTNFYDMATGLKVKTSSVIEIQGQSATITMYYYDYTDVKGGLKYPFRMKQSVGPQSFNITVKSVELNTGVSDEVFK